MLNSSLYMLLLISIVLGWLWKHHRLVVVSSLVAVVVYSGIVSVSVLIVHIPIGIWYLAAIL